MNNILKFIIFGIITKIKCELEAVNEENNENEILDNIPKNYKVNIERRFLEDLEDYEWHVAHLRGAQFDGRRDCMDDTFSDKVRRYRKMLKSDGALVEFVSSDPISVDPADITQDSCKVDIEKYDVNVSTLISTTAGLTNATNSTTTNSTTTTTTQATTVGNVTRYTENVAPTTAALNISTVMRATVSMPVAPTTPALDLKATTVGPKQTVENDTLDKVRRASEYMFSSIEYYDDSIEFDPTVCPDAVEAITLEIDQLRSYDLECEMTLEWRSLE